jgi:hypothetical protein
MWRSDVRRYEISSLMRNDGQSTDSAQFTEAPERVEQGLKARVSRWRLFGTTEVVPFQSSFRLSFPQPLKPGAFKPGRDDSRG